MPTEGYHLSSLDSVEAHCWAVGTVLYTLLAAVDHLADGAEQGFWARAQRARVSGGSGRGVRGR